MRTYYVSGIPFSDELYHHGIKGQKWGARRYQNPDGSLTPLGQKKYGTVENFNASRQGQKLAKQKAQQNKVSTTSSKAKTAAKIGLAIAGAGLAAYGGYKLSKAIDDNNTKYAADLFDSQLSKIFKAQAKSEIALNKAFMNGGSRDGAKFDKALNRLWSNTERRANKAQSDYDRIVNSNILKKASNAYKYAKKMRLKPSYLGVRR